jgi:hypothetical protein
MAGSPSHGTQKVRTGGLVSVLPSKENIPNFFWILIYFANFLAVIC